MGAFNLVRRSALERTPGFEHLKLEQADDVALGQMLKLSGARCAVANGRGEVGLHFYRSLRDMARGIEKSGARWPLAGICAAMATLLALELGPWLALAAPGGWAAIGAAGVGLSVAATLGVARWMRRPVLAASLRRSGSSSSRRSWCAQARSRPCAAASPGGAPSIDRRTFARGAVSRWDDAGRTGRRSRARIQSDASQSFKRLRAACSSFVRAGLSSQ